MIVGDFNFRVNNHKCPKAREFLTLLKTYDLTQHVSGPTQRRGNTLDLVITRSTSSILRGSPDVYYTGIGDGRGSSTLDHCAVQSYLRLPSSVPLAKTISCRDLKNFKQTDFRHDLITFLSEPADPAVAVDTYNSVVRSYYDEHAPVTTKTIKTQRDAKWYTPELREMKRKRRAAERTMRSNSPPLTVHVEIHEALCMEENKLMQSTKESYFSDQVSSAKGDPKAMYKVSKSLIGQKPEVILPDNIPDEVLCEKFNNFFYNKIKTIRDKISTNSTPLDPAIREIAEPAFEGVKLLQFNHLSEDDVRTLITSSKSKTCRSDPIPTSLVKECLGELLPTITDIVNHSLKRSEFHPSFKRAIVRPLLKKPGLDRNCLQNYRPVSNLPFISKIIEKAVLQQLDSHFTVHGLDDPFQSAYRKAHSTETALLKVHNDIALALDVGKSVILVLLDLSAAFDTIDHHILLRRLEHEFGLAGDVIKWVESYLTGRKQVVCIGERESSEISLDVSVPQGSLLGPKFYCNYSKPVTAIIRYHGMLYHIYADDSQIYITVTPANDIANITSNIERCVADVSCWMSENKLKLNEGKTELIVFNGKRRGDPYADLSLTLGGNTITPAPVVKNLGVYLDKALTMEDHITNVVRVCNFQIRNIQRIRSSLTEDACKMLVHSLVTSRLDYCNSLLAGLPDTSLDPLRKVQYRAARLITRTPMRDHMTPVLKDLHWLKIPQRIDFKLLVLTFKCLHDQAPRYLADLLKHFTPSRQSRTVHSDYELVIPRYKLESYGAHSFKIAAPVVWNALPDFVRAARSVDSFKKRLKTHLFKSHY